MALGIEKNELDYMRGKTNRTKLTTGEEESGFLPPCQSYSELKKRFEGT